MIVRGMELNQDKKGVPLVVARDWGENEEEQQRPLVGDAGVLFDEMLSYAGFRRSEVNITNVVPETRPFANDFRKHSEQAVEAGRAALNKWVKRLQPSLIITMGNEAAYHFVPDWPSGGRGIFNAKGIEDRRGYFWETPSGWVLTVMHPAGALRKIVPGYELLRRDFVRARRWLRGKLPRQEFPNVQTLSSHMQVEALLKSNVLAADIETRFGKQVFTCGFTGDDLQPYVAKFGRGFTLMHDLLAGRKSLKGVFHNGPYDVDLLDRGGFPTGVYTDDTQTAWWALEPELAARDEGEHGGRLTRKGLASLASLHPSLNCPYYKEHWSRPNHPGWQAGYPEEGSDNPDELAKLYVMAGRDTYVTRRLWDWLWPEVQRRQVEPQYRLAFETNLRCITTTRRGWLVNDGLRQERITVLSTRSESAKTESAAAALAYIEKHQIKDFEKVVECRCCSGVGERCWRCAGLQAMPKKKAEYAVVFTDWQDFKVSELKARLPICKTCAGAGESSHYVFNPHSTQQLTKLFYQHCGAPQWVHKGKTHMDEMATLSLLRWAEEGVRK